MTFTFHKLQNLLLPFSIFLREVIFFKLTILILAFSSFHFLIFLIKYDETLTILILYFVFPVISHSYFHFLDIQKDSHHFHFAFSYCQIHFPVISHSFAFFLNSLSLHFSNFHFLNPFLTLKKLSPFSFFLSSYFLFLLSLSKLKLTILIFHF